MKSKAVTTVGGLFAPALRTLRKTLLKLPKANFRSVIDSDLPKEGIYLIFDDQGILLYVGYSGKNLKSRIRSHVSSADPFMRWLMKESGIVVSKRVHRCTCGLEQNCSSGETVTEGFVEAYEKMKAKMYDTFFVAVLDYRGRELPIYGRSLEQFAQWMLRPKYGSWHHPLMGQEEISADSWFHPSVDAVLAALDTDTPVYDTKVMIDLAAKQTMVEKGATYRHFKGKLYTVIGLAEDSNLKENNKVVIYQKKETGETYVRPVSQWSEMVTVEGIKTPRFLRVE